MDLGKFTGPKILLTGSNGQLGQAFLRLFARLNDDGALDVVATDLGGHVGDEGQNQVPFMACDLADSGAVTALLDTVRPGLILNCAAYTAVDRAEGEPDIARNINAVAPGILAEWAARNGAVMIHYSTDYVFDGTGDQPRQEDHPAAPMSVYGQTKLDGEKAVLGSGVRGAIFRTSWVYSDHGHNFVKTMLRLAREREELRVVADQVGAPTSAHFLARASWQAAQNIMTSASATTTGRESPRPACQVYHLVPRGWVSWHGFAEAIVARARQAIRDGQGGSETGTTTPKICVQRIVPIATSEYPTPAKRPLNSRLDCSKFERDFGVELPSWEEGFEEVMDALLTTH